ncbi:MAG: tRNA pseudouridine(13) synthase TruD [Euryarchaeota archaeon RBG_13_31_8]|nr:MAG: tRNA pseudouridine(13) synthase TruD [Euryarchaeota archaeon RBG_13_31_8]
MKIKQFPNDFIVEEIPIIEISKEKKEHAIYILEKQEMDTFEALRLIANSFHISSFEIGYAGLKDKHGLTKQYISIPARHNIKSKDEKNLKLEFIGYNNKKIKTGDLKGNRFTITVRNIQKGDTPGFYSRAKTIPEIGVPNYFDSQRFGSVIHNEFIAKYLIQKNYEQAVKIFLTKYLKSERRKIKDEKKKILANWKNLELMKVNNKIFKSVINEYIKTKSWVDAYKKIPPNLREMFVNAYQSYLWNECVKESLKKIVGKERLYNINYNIGNLLFYNKLIDVEIKKIPLTFQTISPTMKFSSEFEEDIIKNILLKENIGLENLDIEKVTGNFFKSRKRELILKPQEFTISDFEMDEINDKGKKKIYKIILSFILLKGSYATIVTKRIFGH